MQPNQTPNPNDPRFLNNQPRPQIQVRPPPPQYPVQNNLSSPFLLDQSLPSTSTNYENPNLPKGYNNEQYILDMDKLYRGFENPVLTHQKQQPQINRNFEKNIPKNVRPKEKQESKHEDDTLVEIIQDIKETKLEKPILKPAPPNLQNNLPQQNIPQNNYNPNLYRNNVPITPNPQNNFEPSRRFMYNQIPNQNNQIPNRNNQIPNRNNQIPNQNNRFSMNSQKLINSSIKRHCQIYKLDKKNPIIFNCHQCKSQIRSVVIQE